MLAKQIYVATIVALFVAGSIWNIVLFKMKRGINPIPLLKAGSRVERYIGLIFLVAVLFYVVGGIMLAVRPDWEHRLHLFRTLDHSSVQLLGFFLCLASMVTISLAQRTMGSSWRIGIDPEARTVLVTTGIFRYSRNPIFGGMLVLAAGISLILPNVASLLVVTVSAFAINVQVRIEEDFLEKTHGDAYRKYLDEVGRFFPKLKLSRRRGPPGAVHGEG